MLLKILPIKSFFSRLAIYNFSADRPMTERLLDKAYSNPLNLNHETKIKKHRLKLSQSIENENFRVALSKQFQSLFLILKT